MTREVLSTEIADKRGMLRELQEKRGGDRSSRHIKRALQESSLKASPAKVATAAAAETARLFASNLNQVCCWPEEIHTLSGNISNNQPVIVDHL